MNWAGYYKPFDNPHMFYNQDMQSMNTPVYKLPLLHIEAAGLAAGLLLLLLERCRHLIFKCNNPLPPVNLCSAHPTTGAA